MLQYAFCRSSFATNTPPTPFSPLFLLASPIQRQIPSSAAELWGLPRVTGVHLPRIQDGMAL